MIVYEHGNWSLSGGRLLYVGDHHIVELSDEDLDDIYQILILRDKDKHVESKGVNNE